MNKFTKQQIDRIQKALDDFFFGDVNSEESPSTGENSLRYRVGKRQRVIVTYDKFAGRQTIMLKLRHVSLGVSAYTYVEPNATIAELCEEIRLLVNAII